ncbi:hypothetical protein ABLT15_15485 [Paraburkholderia tropica]|uniref:hypothetical protein n=1 Tax=Paraburkholderia tropica TaxID=92647 RepID=UPI0032B5F92F
MNRLLQLWLRLRRHALALGAVPVFIGYHSFINSLYEGRIEAQKAQIENLKAENDVLHHTQCDVQFSQIDAERKLADLRMTRFVSSMQMLGGVAANPDDVTSRYLCLRLKR